jgi:hypothetical protein
MNESVFECLNYRCVICPNECCDARIDDVDFKEMNNDEEKNYEKIGDMVGDDVIIL